MIVVLEKRSDFNGLIRYCARPKLGDINNPEKSIFLDTNLGARRTEKELISQFNKLRKERPDRERVVYHNILNPAIRDEIGRDKWSSILEFYFEQMDIDTGQYPFVSYLHKNIKRPHLHVVVSRVGVDGSILSTTDNFRKSIIASARIERKFELMPACTKYLEKLVRKDNKWAELELSRLDEFGKVGL
jgi:hypothetical protein